MSSSGWQSTQLTPGTPLQMLSEALSHLLALPHDRMTRANAFELFAKQIESHSGGAWSAVRGTGTDGSDLFLGRQGEGLVIAPDGGLFRGAIGKGIDVTPTGLRPDYHTLKAIN